MVWTSPVSTDIRLKLPVFLLLALPLMVLGFNVASEIVAPGSRLGADPGKAVVLYLGEWTIRMLLLTLAVSSARRLTGQTKIMRFRRMVGLFAFTYLSLHFLAYLGFLAGFDGGQILEDLSDRPYITVGFLALLLLAPLAVTSTNGWRRRLGRRWVRLHRLVYPAIALGLIHYFWLTKDGYGENVLYLTIFLLLIVERLMNARRSGRRSPLPDS
jgi:sulfoxide reductase heme-binding subunit YedZ